ncbi:MAG: MBL fold metallo-hydrolase [Deltaproteobacteria bacterium]|nr:MBL fold metallo-hydrolase [Deltaproteobacteria bacterium]
MAESKTLFFKQLLSGRHHARVHPVAGQMMNFAYLVGCRETGQCLAVDPSWDPRGIVEIAEENRMKVVGSVATHCHPDHIGGQMMGMDIPGVREITELTGGPVHVHKLEAAFLCAITGVSETRLMQHEDEDLIALGQLSIRVLHTPGHSPGHICLLVENHLITGDVLFVGACGRVDLPGAEPKKMVASLKKLASLPEETIVFPGHHYGSAVTSTIGEEKRSNPYMRFREDDWEG